MRLSVRRRLRGLAAMAALSALALGATAVSSAQASVLSLSACDGSLLSQPFLPWVDANAYKLVPGGDFEGALTGWSLTGPAAVVAGSEPAAATGTLGAASLSLAASGSAQAPETCVNAAYPSFRFFARSDTPGSLLAVSVVYQTFLGQVVAPVGVVGLGLGWAPTAPMVTGSAVPGLLSGGTAPVGLRFTQLTGSAQIDDVYVDPWTMH